MFHKISCEDDLNNFEQTISEQKCRLEMQNYFVGVMGKVCNAPIRSIALQLEQKMFTQNFWSQTAWTGGRKADGPRKFVFSTHIVFISFFNKVHVE